MEIKSIGIIGSGTIGHGIAQVAAATGVGKFNKKQIRNDYADEFIKP